MMPAPELAGLDPAALVALRPGRYPAVLESSAHSPVTGRYDLLPIADGRWLELADDGRVRDQHGRDLGGDFAGALDGQFSRERAPPSPPDAGRPPFAGGWLLYLGYEAAAGFEPRLRLPPFAGCALPVALAVRTPAAWLRDCASGAAVLVAEPGYQDLLADLRRDVAAALALAPAALPDCTMVEDAPERFLDGVARIQDYLRAGDVFQVNLSRAWRARFAGQVDPVAVFRRLRRLNPAPFSALLRWRDASVISASPERLLRVRGRRIETRPIAGTRPRGADAAADRALRAELLGHPKERAEHVMLIDLERNDLGRVCRPGTIRVDELMAVETHTHVHHIVSNVTGELRPQATPGSILRALFPGGTITGCPKVRCMEIIAELEGIGRGPYTGALGYLDAGGDMDLNILIRSAWQQGDRLGFRTGAGIVIDSVPERELAETRAKAGGMLALCRGDGTGTGGA